MMVVCLFLGEWMAGSAALSVMDFALKISGAPCTTLKNRVFFLGSWAAPGFRIRQQQLT
jgi:hypothetical protein